MEIIEINNKKYIIGERIFEYAPLFCKGSRNPRELIKAKKINPPEFICARKDKDGGWIETDGKSKRLDKVLFLESFVGEIPEVQKYMSEERKVENKEESKRFEKYNIDQLPPIIELEDNEKFKDDNGNIYDIETRGERQVDKIYFRAEDVSKHFDLENLERFIKDKTKYCVINEHYKIFCCKFKTSSATSTNKIQKKVYLTYQGMLKVLFSSRSPKVKKFVKWATETLFSIQMGTVERKRELVSDILGMNPKIIREVLNTSATTLPAVYLLTLGRVEKLRDKFGISRDFGDDGIICKFGFTRNLSQRLKEHQSVFSKIGAEVSIKYYSFIDPQFLSNAESKIKNFFGALNIKLDYENYTELVVIPKHLFETTLVKDQYEQISKMYSGHYTEVVEQIKNLENELKYQKMSHQMELERYKNDLIIKDKDIELLKSDLIIKDKDNELLNYKIKFLEMEKKLTK